MGLLDSILGGVLNNAAGQGQSAPAGGGMNAGLMAALLPIVLSMLRGQPAGAAASAGGGMGGGLGDVLGGMLGGNRGGGGLGDVLGSVLGGGIGGTGSGSLGGLGALLAQFQKAGFSDHVASWVGTGDNTPLSADAIGQVFGNDALGHIAKQAGVSTDDASAGLAQLLPQLVDHLTPNGQMPAADQLAKGLESLGLGIG
jgi:uncharacterized protein YidB (DUF937 family)